MENDENDENEIEINEFLKFLKIACHLNDLIRDSKGTTSRPIDFDELASNKIVNQIFGFNKNKNNENINIPTVMDNSIDKSNCDRKKRGNIIEKKKNRPLSPNECDGGSKKQIHPKLSSRLNYLINEGVLDSMLPYVCPIIPNANVRTNPAAAKTPKCKTEPNGPSPNQDVPKEPAAKEVATPKETTSAKEISAKDESEPVQVKETKPNSKRKTLAEKRKDSSLEKRRQEPEVIIHVCDELKNTFRDFTCPQKLLTTKMGYFAEVTAGQKLEDMDISVHCDIQIFEWLMKWIKKNSDSDSPQLDPSIVVPILVSASFLQMEPLLQDCLSFFHARMHDVIRASTNLACLNDSIITRLAAMFTNLELEVVKDKRERITPRLWTKLIQSLCEPEPQALRGHYYSLCGLYRCSKCCKYLTQTMSSYITCIPSNVRLNRWGQLISQHTRDANWDLSAYVASLFKELKSWRKVYWKLWGHCHILYCCTCETHFPVYQMTWCRFHPEGPQYLGPAFDDRIAGPTGRYPCCGQQAFRYETLVGPNGCQFREHSVLTDNDRDRAIFTLLHIAAEGGSLYENPPIKFSEEISKQPQEPRWAGLNLAPNKCRHGILPPLCSEETNGKLSRKLRLGTSPIVESSSETDTSATPEKLKKRPLVKCSTSSDGCESENSSEKVVCRRRSRRGKAEVKGRFWSGELSARSNQDHQREYEEKIMKHVTTAVGKKTGTVGYVTQSTSTNCGTYARLEAEWKEQTKHKNNMKLRFK